MRTRSYVVTVPAIESRTQTSHVFNLKGNARSGPAAELRAVLLEHGSSWMEGLRNG